MYNECALTVMFELFMSSMIKIEQFEITHSKFLHLKDKKDELHLSLMPFLTKKLRLIGCKQVVISHFQLIKSIASSL